jgi:cytochrome b6-f complex iron-sulfur subunit
MFESEATPSQKRISRRQFIGLMWVGALLATMGQAAAALLQFLTPRIKPGAFGSRVKAGKVSEFAADSVTYFRETRFYLVRLEQGYLALSRKCPHLGCVVGWVEDEGRFNCPCHSAIFDRQGEVLSGPPPRPMDIFPVEVEGDDLYVDTSNAVQRTRFEESQVTNV